MPKTKTKTKAKAKEKKVDPKALEKELKALDKTEKKAAEKESGGKKKST